MKDVNWSETNVSIRAESDIQNELAQLNDKLITCRNLKKYKKLWLVYIGMLWIIGQIDHKPSEVDL